MPEVRNIKSSVNNGTARHVFKCRDACYACGARGLQVFQTLVLSFQVSRPRKQHQDRPIRPSVRNTLVRKLAFRQIGRETDERLAPLLASALPPPRRRGTCSPPTHLRLIPRTYTMSFLHLCDANTIRPISVIARLSGTGWVAVFDDGSKMRFGCRNDNRKQRFIHTLVQKYGPKNVADFSRKYPLEFAV